MWCRAKSRATSCWQIRRHATSSRTRIGWRQSRGPPGARALSLTVSESQAFKFAPSPARGEGTITSAQLSASARRLLRDPRQLLLHPAEQLLAFLRCHHRQLGHADRRIGGGEPLGHTGQRVVWRDLLAVTVEMRKG